MAGTINCLVTEDKDSNDKSDTQCYVCGGKGHYATDHRKPLEVRHITWNESERQEENQE